MHNSMNLDNNIQEGFILSIKGDIAHVRVAPNADCGTCGSCETSHVELYAYNAVNAKIGRKVRFTMANDNMIKIAFMIFIFPLFSIFAGIYSGTELASHYGLNSNVMSFLGAVIFLAAAVFIVYLYDKKFKHNKKKFPQVIEVVND